MSPAPPGPSKYRVAGTPSRKTVDGGTPASSGVEAQAGWANVEDAVDPGYKPRFDVPPPNRKARREAAAKARRR